jgi:hypothetical protein
MIKCAAFFVLGKPKFKILAWGPANMADIFRNFPELPYATARIEPQIRL